MSLQPASPVAAPVWSAGYTEIAPRQEFRRDIQGLRALAVLLVIGTHAAIPGFAGGYVGVDVFFVISGYVITELLLREATKGPLLGLAEFYSRRIRRIAPAATATLVGTLVVAALVLGPSLNPHLPGDVRWASLFAANFRLIATGSNYFVAGVYPSLITQFWSLAVEEQFYLVFPLVVFLIARLVPPGRRLRVLALTLLVGVALSAWWSMHISAADPTPAYYSPFTRFWELGLGCLLAIATARHQSRPVWAALLATVLGVVLLVLALVSLNATSVFPGWRAWLPCGATALFIWAGAGGARTPITRLLATRPLGYIGNISYSLYLVHFMWMELPKQLATPHAGWAWTVVEIAGTVVTAVCSYHLLENPIRRSKRLAADGVATGLMLCLCVAASWTTATIVAKLLHLA